MRRTTIQVNTYKIDDDAPEVPASPTTATELAQQHAAKRRFKLCIICLVILTVATFLWGFYAVVRWIKVRDALRFRQIFFYFGGGIIVLALLLWVWKKRKAKLAAVFCLYITTAFVLAQQWNFTGAFNFTLVFPVVTTLGFLIQVDLVHLIICVSFIVAAAIADYLKVVWDVPVYGSELYEAGTPVGVFIGHVSLVLLLQVGICYLLGIFATLVKKERAKITQILQASTSISKHIAVMDLNAAEEELTQHNSPLLLPLQQIVSNLRLYRPYLPDSLLAAVSGADDIDDDEDEQMIEEDHHAQLGTIEKIPTPLNDTGTTGSSDDDAPLVTDSPTQEKTNEKKKNETNNKNNINNTTRMQQVQHASNNNHTSNGMMVGGGSGSGSPFSTFSGSPNSSATKRDVLLVVDVNNNNPSPAPSPPKNNKNVNGVNSGSSGGSRDIPNVVVVGGNSGLARASSLGSARSESSNNSSGHRSKQGTNKLTAEQRMIQAQAMLHGNVGVLTKKKVTLGLLKLSSFYCMDQNTLPIFVNTKDRDNTSAAEQKALTALSQQFLDCCVECVRGSKGVVLEFGMDWVLCGWNITINTAAHAAAASRASLQINKQITPILNQWMEKHQHRVSFQCGIVTDFVGVGQMGTSTLKGLKVSGIGQYQASLLCSVGAIWATNIVCSALSAKDSDCSIKTRPIDKLQWPTVGQCCTGVQTLSSSSTTTTAGFSQQVVFEVLEEVQQGDDEWMYVLEEQNKDQDGIQKYKQAFKAMQAMKYRDAAALFDATQQQQPATQQEQQSSTTPPPSFSSSSVLATTPATPATAAAAGGANTPQHKHGNNTPNQRRDSAATGGGGGGGVSTPHPVTPPTELPAMLPSAAAVLTPSHGNNNNNSSSSRARNSSIASLNSSGGGSTVGHSFDSTALANTMSPTKQELTTSPPPPTTIPAKWAAACLEMAQHPPTTPYYRPITQPVGTFSWEARWTPQIRPYC